MTKLPSPYSHLASRAFDSNLSTVPPSKQSPSSILSPLPRQACAAPGMANESSPSLAPRLPVDSSSSASNDTFASHPDLAFRAAASCSPLSPPPPPLPFTLSASTREPLPNFAFPSAYSAASFLPDLSGGLPLDDSSILRGPVAPNYLSSPYGAPTTLDQLLSGVNDSAAVAGPLSANGAATQQPSSHLVQRLIQQNNKIRDAWEAERKYLEANRRRAEEVYEEERAIMEDLRESWLNEKTDLLSGMQLLRERIQRLEGENSALKAMAQTMSQVTGVLSPLSSQRGGSVDGSADHSPSGFPAASDAAAFAAEHMPLHKHAGIPSVNAVAASLPPGLDGASRRPHFASPPRQHLSPPTAALDPRTQPEASVLHDFLASPFEEVEVPVAVIDVHEIDPKLEGISLKAIAVQKPTFATHASPPATHRDHPYDEDTSPLPKPHPIKNESMRVLGTGASRRLTMNAGHTPIHSLSAFPTMTTATGASSVVSRSGDSTPTKAASSPPRETLGYHEDSILDSDHLDETHDETSLLPDADRESEADTDDFLLEPSEDDRPLRGPLMVKNIPAQDELFWAAVNKKLEPISQGQDALPTVMQTPIAEIDAIQWPSTTAPLVDGGNEARNAQTSKKHDDVDDDLDTNGESSTKEHDVPLRLKTTTNFGAPFGMM